MFLYAFSVFLILSFIFVIICRCDSVAGRSLLPIWQIWKESRNMQRKGTRFQGRVQQERSDTKVKPHSGLEGSMETRTSTRNPDSVERSAPAKHVKRSQSGRPKALESLCNLATLWTFLHLPTVAAAYDFKSGVGMTEHGTICISMLLLIGTPFVLIVRKSVQNYLKNFRDGVRGSLAKYSYMLWIAGGLLSMVMVLASAINDVNGLEDGDNITKVQYLVFAILFAALVLRVHGTCRFCKKAKCICPNGPGGGSGTSLVAAATHLDIENGASH